MAGLFSPNVFLDSSSDVLFPRLKRDPLFDSLSKMMDVYESNMQAQDVVKKEYQHSFTTRHHQHQQQSEMIPFDSPLDQSLGSPESTRDYSSSPFQNYEFDFSGVEDAIMFPNHGTQEMHNDDAYLAEFPLFGNFSKQEQSLTFPGASQQFIEDEAAAAVNTGNPCDFSFDAMTTTTTTQIVDQAAPSPAPSSPYFSQDHQTPGINQLAVVFVREYARTHPLNNIDVLLRALRVTGIEVSDQVVAEIFASASVVSCNSPSPSPLSASSPMSLRQSSQSVESGSVSPMSLPVSALQATPPVVATTTTVAAPTEKTRSSFQSSTKDHLVIDTRYGKRFVCSICSKQFDRAFNLRTHAMTHIDPEDRDKPFMCPWGECSKNFSRKYDAERHYRSVHFKKGEVATKQQIQAALSGRHHYHDDEDDSPSNG